MKPRKARDLRELNDQDLLAALREAEETLAKQRFQLALKQLTDTAYVRILRKDIARMKTILHERNIRV
jgi:large subunit ribosomal protein L29